MFIHPRLNKLFQKISADDLLLKLLKGGATTFFLRTTGFFIGYLFVILISRFYGAETLGAFSIATTVLLIFTIAGRMGLDTFVVKHFSQQLTFHNWNAVYGIYTQILRITVTAGIILSVLLFFLSNIVAEKIFHKPLALELKIVSIAVLPMILRFINSECYRGMGLLKTYAWSQHVSYFFYAFVLLAVVTLFFRSKYLPVICYTISLLILCFSSTFLLIKRIKKHVKKEAVPVYSSAELIKSSLPMMLSSSLMLLSGWINTLMLGAWASEKETGIYTVVLKIATFTSIVLMSVNSVAGPGIAAAAAQNDKEKMQAVTSHAAKINFIASLPVFIAIIFLRNFILRIFGEEFTAGADVLLVLLAAQVINNFSGAVGTFLNMTGHAAAFQNIVLLSTVVNLVLCFILIPQYGIWGSAIAGSVYMILWNVIAAIYIKKISGIQTWYNPFAN